MNWFEVKALATGREISIYNNIGGDGITAKAFKDELDKGKGPITLRINSVGGVVTEGIAIYNMLKKYSGRITVHIDSIAASMATAIAMAGDTITMEENALFMIHNPWGASFGDAQAHAKTAEVLEKMQVVLVDIYNTKTGIKKELIQSMMTAETWMDAAMAKENGFIDTIEGHADSAEVKSQKDTFFSMKLNQIIDATAAHQYQMQNTTKELMKVRRKIQTNSPFSQQHLSKANYSGIKHV